MFKEVHPVLPVRDIHSAVEWYTERLGFALAFRDPSEPGHYAGVRREGVELHLQWHAPESFEREGVDRLNLRFLVTNPDALFEQYKTKDIFHARTILKDTPWGTREFAFYDPDGNGLTFYRDL